MLYILATFFYPGGNEIDTSVKGFSWQHNYWCELLAPHAENGEINAARPIAISAMILLAISLAAIWIFIPRILNLPAFGKKLIRFAGILSMASLFFLFIGARSHDTVLNISGILGIAALITTLVGLVKTRLYTLFILGLICLLLCLLNNYIYYTKNYLFYLAIIQKISFLIFLTWFGLLNILVYRKMKSQS